jgi:hypothetical protein
MKSFYEMLSVMKNINLLSNKEETMFALGVMEGDHILKKSGDNSIVGAIEWLANNPDGYYVVYGDGGVNRYFVRANGDVEFSKSHAMYPSKQTIKKANDLGFKIF